MSGLIKAMIVYGCPCAGKSTYVMNHAGDNDVIYDYDAIISASTTRKKRLVDRHAAHFVVLSLRKALVDSAKNEKAIDRLWLICSWPTDMIKELLDGVDSEEIFIDATKEECYARLEADDTRPDKNRWRAIIDAWFDTYKETQQARKEDSMADKFWNFYEGDERVLRLDGPIDSDNFWGDEVTPKSFCEELNAGEGDLTIWINSPGGNVFAAAEIYSMLRDYKGKKTVKIDALAASAASVIAMAGDKVLISPVALMMIHDPMTCAAGNAKDMEKVINTLNEIKESIINAYQAKTGLSRKKIAQLMEDETWLNAKKAVELGFADEVLFTDGSSDFSEEGKAYSARAMGNAIIDRIVCTAERDAKTEDESAGTGDTGQVLDEKLTVIGLDGKAGDGSMPYELLKKQLEFLR